MELSILDNAADDIASFNEIGLHYEIVSEAVHRERERLAAPFSLEYIRYITAGLISFDMGRFMGTDKYSFDGGFASRLNNKLQAIRSLIESLNGLSLPQADLNGLGDNIKQSYRILASRGKGSLDSNPNKAFHVGTTKILHFLNPELFIIIDSNAARVFRKYWNVPFRNSTQPGYTPELYLECMKRVQSEINEYGLEKFQNLEPNTPITRIFDKITFVIGSKMK